MSDDARAPAGRSFLRANRVSLPAAAAAVALAAAVLLFTPNAHGLTSLWDLLFHLAPFLAATVAIAWLDLPWARRLRLPLILPPLCFLAFFTVFVPYIFVYFTQEDFDGLYYTQLMLVPFIILSLALAVRLGGAATGTVARLAIAMLLLQLSGIEDLAFVIVSSLHTTGTVTVPEVWDWADHIAVRLGHYPSSQEAYVFIAVHVAAAVAVLAVPARLLRTLVRRPGHTSRRDDVERAGV